MQTTHVDRHFFHSRAARVGALTIAVAGVGGFVVGWMARPSAGEAVAPQPTTAASLGIAQVTHTFPLLPADMGSDRETPTIAADAQGRILVAWASQTGESERTIFLARSQDGGSTFEAPAPFRKVPIARFKGQSGKGMTFSTSVLPRLVASGAAFYLGWVEAVHGDSAQVKYFVSRSDDGGRTFSEPTCSHGSEAVRPGFTAFSAGADGVLCCAWLDGRNRAQQPFFSATDRTGAVFQAATMVYAGGGGKGVCPCCDLANVRAENGTAFVAFRNAEAGNRDIWVARSRSGGADGFEPPIPVTPDHWPFDGCPHDGPALAVSGGRLSVLWMDAHTGKRRVYASGTDLADLHFAPPREVNPQSPHEQGHPKLAVSGTGATYAVWDENLAAATDAPATSHASGKHEHAGHQHGTPLVGSGRAIMCARMLSAGESFERASAIAPRPGGFQLQPTIVATISGDVCVVWNELTVSSKSVVFARLPR